MHPLKCRFCQSTQKTVADEQNTKPPHVEDPIFVSTLWFQVLPYSTSFKPNGLENLTPQKNLRSKP
jgi:hypothetical protein